MQEIQKILDSYTEEIKKFMDSIFVKFFCTVRTQEVRRQVVLILIL